MSQPAGLPDFKTLTENVFARLGIEMQPAERHPFTRDRFEEALGALSRRLADKRLLYSAVAAELAANDTTDLPTHSTILRISRDFEGRPALVTTNFDTLFERALHQQTQQPIRTKSYAGAQIPAPGGPRFEGIIHLHGRLADQSLNLDETELVLTSADYGDAYLRSGWAAQFLYDLARIRTVVLVGYSASDPPVRYILNILEADRERFPDLKEIFAFANSRGEEPEETAAAWQAIAVTPVIFETPAGDFRPFWQDMKAWADLVEVPRQWRTCRLQALSSRLFPQLHEWEREQAAWIFGHPDAVELLSQHPFSPEWIAFLRSRNLLKPDRQSEWSLGRWAAARLADPQALRAVLESLNAIGSTAADTIERALAARDRQPIPSDLEKAWRLLTASARQPQQPDHWRAHAAFGRLKAESANGHHLSCAVHIFAPRLHLRPPYVFHRDEYPPLSLSSVCRVELDADRFVSVDELLKSLPAGSTDTWPLLQLATGSLIHSLLLAHDAELTGGAYDSVSRGVPSISHHKQNEHHYGFLPLVRLCAELWRKLLPIEPHKAEATANYWKQAGFALTTRLWLFALHSNQALQADAIADALVGLPSEDFWEHRKEVMELLRDRTANATPAKLEQLFARILTGPTVPGGGEPQLKQRVLDSYVWLYLMALSADGRQLQTVLDQINERTNWSNRKLEESDFFWMWSYGVRTGPIGDPAPIAEAPTEKRVEIASDLEKRDILNQADAWRVYAKQDPEGALAAIIAANDVSAHAQRWRDVLWAIAEIGDATEQSKTHGRQLFSRAFDFLRQRQAAELAELVHPLVDLYAYALKIGAPLDDSVWDFLWQLSLADNTTYQSEGTREDPGYELISHAINSPAGKLAQMMINHLGPPWQGLSQEQQQRIRDRFRLAIGTASISGSFARAVTVEYVAWLHASLPELLENDLLPHLRAQHAEALALRSILVGMSQSVGRALRANLREPLLRGVAEYRGETVAAENAASRLVAYVHDDLDRSATDAARLQPNQAKATLAAASPHMSAAAAEVMANWLAAPNSRPPHERWRAEFGRMFQTIWPADKMRQTNQASVALARLAISAGDAFPEALDTVAPYIVPLDEDWPHLHFAARHEARPIVDRFPRHMLELLWRLLKPAQRGQSNDLAEVLDRIAAADPNLVRDRRFQLLETRALRLS